MVCTHKKTKLYFCAQTNLQEVVSVSGAAFCLSPSVLTCFSFPRAKAREDLGQANGMTERALPWGINSLLEKLQSYIREKKKKNNRHIKLMSKNRKYA